MIEFIKAMPKLREKIFFRKEDLLDLNVSEDVIETLLKEELLRKMDCGIYTLSDKEVRLLSDISLILPELLFWKQTYITGKYVLVKNNIIFDVLWHINCVAEKKEILRFDNQKIKTLTKVVDTPKVKNYRFVVTNCPVEDMANIFTVKMATLEQALVDYFSTFENIVYDFFVLDFDDDVISEKINFEKLKKIRDKLNNKTLIETINNFLTWCKYE